MSVDQILDNALRTWGPAGGALAVLLVAVRLIWRFQEAITEAAITDATTARAEAKEYRAEAHDARLERDEALAEAARLRRLLIIHDIDPDRRPGPRTQ